ncbi:MAG: MOSC domain-containing protein [Flavobacteriales bacterium]|jgi:MOSC domain-containing protein YiiM|nr:MOSC domain-containing protein [Flavobacteriales bacterium]
MKVISVNKGERKEIQWQFKKVTTGIFKYPVKTITLGLEDVVGDNVVDRKYHGGVDQAVYAYALNHYKYWQEQYPDLDFNFGMFGENLTISNLIETDIHIGDVFTIGTAKIEVTKPREPCSKLGIRFGDAKIIRQFWNSTKCGVYFKVLKIGEVNAGDTFVRTIHKSENPTIADVYKSKKPTE